MLKHVYSVYIFYFYTGVCVVLLYGYCVYRILKIIKIEEERKKEMKKRKLVEEKNYARC